jgi:hypothetical protein
MHMLGVLGPRDSSQARAEAEAWLRQSLGLSESLGLKPFAMAVRRDLDALLDRADPPVKS